MEQEQALEQRGNNSPNPLQPQTSEGGNINVIASNGGVAVYVGNNSAGAGIGNNLSLPIAYNDKTYTSLLAIIAQQQKTINRLTDKLISMLETKNLSTGQTR